MAEQCCETGDEKNAKEALTRIPQDIKIKPAFEERYRLLLGDRYDEYIKFSSSYIRKCIRVNSLKARPADIIKRLAHDWELTPIPWCPEGFYIDYKHGKRFDIGNLEEHQLGYFYVQDAASMIPPIVLNPQPGESVLDLCSAPGSKTTQLAAMMQNTGLLVANDVDVQRVKPLGLNLQRCGVKNCVVVTRANRKLELESFDKVLVDAPCSGTGTIRRSLKTLLMWSPGLIRRLVRDQRQLILQGFNILKPGGTMVYSTCTQEPEENEGVVSWLLERNENARIEEIELDINRSDVVMIWDGKNYNPSVKNCLRIYPQDNDTEGFFVCKIRKLDN